MGHGVGQEKGFGQNTKTAADAKEYLREYAHRGWQSRGRIDLQDTLLWHPKLFSDDGRAQVSFDLSQNLTTYRVLLFANDPTGRLGFYEGHIETRPAQGK